jgi:hypothetical protein
MAPSFSTREHNAIVAIHAITCGLVFAQDGEDRAGCFQDDGAFPVGRENACIIVGARVGVLVKAFNLGA